MAGEDWSLDEVDAVVADYRHMLVQELAGQAYNKAEHNRRLQVRIGRSHGSIEFKHQNISAVLRDADCFYIPGYKPLGNYQGLLVEIVTRRLLDDPVFDRAVLNAVEQPKLPRIDVDFSRFLEEPPRPSVIADAPAHYGVQPVKRDYLAREARNRSVGEAGELLVVAYERQQLRLAGKDKLADRVEHAAQERGDGLGYDVLSFEPNGRERFIEVKTTGFGKDLPFYMSRRELDFSSEAGEQFHLCRVFGLQREPRMFALQGDMRARLWLDPINYRAGVA